MARVALVGAGAAAATAVRAAARGHEVVVCPSGEIPDDVDLVIAGGAVPATAVPLLVLRDRGSRRNASSDARRTIEMPCDLFDLRAAIEEALEDRGNAADGNSTQAPIAIAGGEPWLGFPRIPAAAAEFLASATGLGGVVWIFGEAGTGTNEAASAFARRWDAGREPIVWGDDEPLAGALARLDDDARVLRVADLDTRSAAEQNALLRYLEGRGRRLVATSGDDPARAAADGALSRALLPALSRIAVRLPPLRERRDDIVALSLEFGSQASREAFAAGGFSLAPSARRVLEDYGWPGNVTELEGAIVRSVLAKGSTNGSRIELHEEDLVLAPAWLGATPSTGSAATAVHDTGPPAPAVASADLHAADVAPAADVSRRAVVVALPAIERSTRQEPTDVEALLAAFAHEIRNPMSTIRTYASLRASDEAAEDAELARLAADACERVDEHLASLQRFAELDQTAAAETVDLVEILAEAADSAGVAMESAAREPLEVVAVLRLARLVADLVVAECGARGAEQSAPAVFEPAGKGTVSIRVPSPSAAVDRLGKWVRGAALPWRLALARDASRRAGGDLEVDVEDGELCLAWRLPPAVQHDRPAVAEEEEGQDGGQARSTDRRRRSRSS